MPTVKAAHTGQANVNNTTPKTFNVNVVPGDVIIVASLNDGTNVNYGAPTASGVTFAEIQAIPNDASFRWPEAKAWAGVATTTNAALTVSVTCNTGDWSTFGYVVGDGQLGASSSGHDNGSVTAPSLALVTEGNNSVIVYFDSDVNGSSLSGRTYRTINGSAGTEGWAQSDGFVLTSFGVSYADAGTAGSKTTGMTVPNQRWSAIAVEVKTAVASFDPRKASEFLLFF